MLFQGMIASISQIYFVESSPGALIILIGLLIYSPIMAAFCSLGAFLGTLTGVMIGGAKIYSEVYAGLWGFNGCLTSAVLGGFCYVVTWQSTLAVLAAIIFATALYNAFTMMLAPAELPGLSLAFNLATMLFLCATSASKHGLIRPSRISFPERHRHEYRQSLKSNKNGSNEEGEEVEEEKEPMTNNEKQV